MEILKKYQELVLLERLVVIEKYFKNINAAFETWFSAQNNMLVLFFIFNININCHCVIESQTHSNSGIFIPKYFSVNQSHLTKQKDFVTVCVF